MRKRLQKKVATRGGAIGGSARMRVIPEALIREYHDWVRVQMTVGVEAFRDLVDVKFRDDGHGGMIVEASYPRAMEFISRVVDWKPVADIVPDNVPEGGASHPPKGE